MENRSYRDFTGTPLYPFGHGLSYTAFRYSTLSLPQSVASAGDSIPVEVTVTNTGRVAGDEVVQLNPAFPPAAGARPSTLRGFQRILLDPGQSLPVHFDLKSRNLGMATEIGIPIIAGGDYPVSIGGEQPDPGAPVVAGDFRVHGQIDLPK